MPQYSATRKNSSDSEYIPIDDIIISADRRQVKMIKAYSHEVITEPLDNFRKIAYTGSDSAAREFSSDHHDDTVQPLGWEKYKNLKNLNPEKP